MCVAVLVVLVEVWVRASWDERMGSPGLFVSDPTRGQRLSANYDGWFAGVPVRINNLGLRDDEDTRLEKGPRTFRILVLGDSVTFGHGSVYSYPELLERLLKEWRPEIDFQVWNAAVPGYNTSQELAQLLEVGPSFRPDLVVVGFFDNDLIDNRPVVQPSTFDVARARVLALVQQHLYSFQLYKRLYLTAGWKLSGSTGFGRRLEHLDTESALLASSAPIHERDEQKLTPFERLSPEEAARRQCPDGERPDAQAIAEMQGDPGWPRWVDAVRGFQELHRTNAYRVLFFLNVVPPICNDHEGDFFYEGGSRQVNDLYLDVMEGPTPAVSVFDTFLHRRPAQMPAARGHAIGNANMAKAEVLFEFLRDRILPDLEDEPPFTASGAAAPPSPPPQ